jgi:hypothetical protein
MSIERILLKGGCVPYESRDNVVEKSGFTMPAI